MRIKLRWIISIVLGLGLFAYIMFLQYSNIVDICRTKEMQKELYSINEQINILNKDNEILKNDKVTGNQELDSLKQNLDKLNTDLETSAKKFTQLN